MRKIKKKINDRTLAALSYVWILFLIPLLTPGKTKLVSFHSQQGVVFFILTTIVGFIYWIPLLGWALTFFVVILFLTGIMNALSGKNEVLPFIGKYAGKLKFKL